MEVGTRMTPQLRFPEFTDEWQTITIGDVYIPLRSNSFSREKLSNTGAVKNIHYGDIHKSLPLHIDMRDIKLPAIIDNTPLSDPDYLQEGDLLIADASEDYADIGKTVEVIDTNGEAILAGLHTIPLRPKTDTALGFGSYLMSTSFVHDQMRKIANGISVYGISKSNLAKIRVSMPQKPEQQKIADYLGGVDIKLTSIQTKVAAMHEYKKGVMQALFSGKLRFKDENGDPYPDWEEKKLGEIARFLKGASISKDDIVDSGKTPAVRYGELYTKYGEIIDDVYSYTNLPTQGLVFSESNDVVIPASGETHIDIATASCVLKAGIALSGDINIIRSDINGVFLAYYLNNAKKHDIARLAQGVSVVHLYSSNLKELRINLPSFKEQQKIADFLSTLDGKIRLEEAKLASAKEFKKALLQRMFI